jgi:Flp pilus assembly protein TadG
VVNIMARLIELPLLRRFANDRSAVSALEFAMILPIMVTLYLGGVEIGQALTINRKVTHITSTLADLVTQSKAVTTTDIENIFDAAAAIVAPYNTGLLSMKITGIQVDENGETAKVVWGDARNDTAAAPNADITIPASVRQADAFVIEAEVHYDYTPAIGYVLTGTLDLSDKFYLQPRLSDAVIRK